MKAKHPDKTSSHSLKNEKSASQMPRTFEEYMHMNECPYLKSKNQSYSRDIQQKRVS